MIKLSAPNIKQDKVWLACAGAIRAGRALKRRMEHSAQSAKGHEQAYKALMSPLALSTISQTQSDAEVVCGSLTVKDMVEIYKYQLVPTAKPARIYYDNIMCSSKGVCPYCGVGVTSALDHFLPKAQFAQFAILPLNLLPSCRDCNEGQKKSYFATSLADQLLHPYAESEQVYEESWVLAKYSHSSYQDGGSFDFSPSPPQGWDDTLKSRVCKHFEVMGLKRLYSIKASSELPVQLGHIKRLHEGGSTKDEINDFLLSAAEMCAHRNTWRAPMYKALAESLDNILM